MSRWRFWYSSPPHSFGIAARRRADCRIGGIWSLSSFPRIAPERTVDHAPKPPPATLAPGAVTWVLRRAFTASADRRLAGEKAPGCAREDGDNDILDASRQEFKRLTSEAPTMVCAAHARARPSLSVRLRRAWQAIQHRRYHARIFFPFGDGHRAGKVGPPRRPSPARCGAKAQSARIGLHLAGRLGVRNENVACCGRAGRRTACAGISKFARGATCSA